MANADNPAFIPVLVALTCIVIIVILFDTWLDDNPPKEDEECDDEDKPIEFLITEPGFHTVNTKD